MKLPIALVVLVLLAACGGAQRVPDARAAEAAAQAKAREDAAAQVRKQQEKEAKEREAVAAIGAAAAPQTALLQTLRDWEARGDAALALAPEVAAVGKKLDALSGLARACAERGPALPAAAAALRETCALAARARTITAQRLASALRLAYGFPEHISEVVPRYRLEGRVTWQQMREFGDLDKLIAQRNQEIAEVLKGWPAPLPYDLFALPLTTRRNLEVLIAQRLDDLDLPIGLADANLASAVRQLVAQQPDVGPFPGQRAEVLEVRALGPAWQPFVNAKGQLLRRTRDVALRVRVAGIGPCVVLWARVEQRAAGRRWLPSLLRFDDDVRFVRCEGPRVPDESMPAGGVVALATYRAQSF